MEKLIFNLVMGNTMPSPTDSLWKEVDWHRLFHLAQRNVVLLRLFDQLAKRQILFPKEQVQTEVSQEEARIQQTFQVMQTLADICHNNGLATVFTKALQHYPDMGHDIDLFVDDPTCRIDEILQEKLGIFKAKSSLTNRVAGKTAFVIPGCHTPLEIHHGRLGHMGEYPQFAKQMIQRKRRVVLNNLDLFVPAVEDQLILCVLQRMYSHLYFRISDFLHAFHLLQRNDLNWAEVHKTAKQLGIESGLISYLACVEAQWTEITGRALVRRKIVIPVSRRARLTFDGHRFPLPKIRIVAYLYGKKILRDILYRNWASVSRLALIPFLIFTSMLRALTFCAKKNDDKLYKNA